MFKSVAPGSKAVPRIVDHAQRREQLAQLAVGLIQRRGAERATVRGIARAGGFSVGVLNHYFRSKDQLLAFTFEWLAQQTFTELDRTLAVTPPGLARVRAALEFMVPSAAAPSFIAIWVGLWSGATRNPALARIHRGYYTRWRRRLRLLLREAVRRGEIAAPPSLPLAVDLLTAGIDGFWIGGSFEPRRFAGRRRRALVAALMKAVLSARSGR